MNIWKGKVLWEVPFGHVLILSGRVKPNPNKICLDLTDNINAKNESETVFLKIEANFRENQIIRSMFSPGEGWQQEEISKNWKSESPKNPIEPGQNFNFRIAVLQKCFEIYVNDNMYGTFEFVKFPKQINYVMVYGDFEKITQFHNRMLYPLIFPKSLICSEKIAFQSDVPRKYETGTVVVMECIAKGPPNTEFSICFQCNDSGRVVLKFHVNFNQTTVTRSYQRSDNSFSAEDEETDGEFPFTRGKLFKIAFGIGDAAFIIAVNGQYFTYFNYPVRYFSISTLKCLTNEVGDFTVKNLEYHSDSMLLSRVEKLSLI
ncbi:32 kDa beta-galactoside-binding lectin-like [Teleopsis dalmanni]|uniref:32 kDa beta-galactoside-binding lectin-like n=1 Tax=Teleopsis dalmanni TaxID=139649 RepID=UPI0018CC898C|nr:32 kDa beta-galactoside-binding lectin-like [Teleopsis dalmanni]XP_037957288.1 32 kDa beta-galactoside-binding lectin-like [Teleopsis dalmanni]